MHSIELILRKDEEIEQLQMLIDHKTQSDMTIDEKFAALKHSPSSTFISCLAGITTIYPHLSDSITVFVDNTISNFVTTLNLVKTIAQLMEGIKFRTCNLVLTLWASEMQV